VSPNGSTLGLLILASGKSGYKKVNMEEYISSSKNEKGFWLWFAEKVSSHPNLPKRIENIK
jgi:Zn-dependent protease with chaperone function